MTTAQFRLDTFEGPLDLLLTLIAKHKMNIYDIEISLLLAQYLEYMEQLEYVDHEYEAEFLEMAARLVYIKTCELLPHENEAEALKRELEGRIIEYSMVKLAAAELSDSYSGGNIFVRKPLVLPVNKTYTREHDPDILLQAYLGIHKRVKESEPLKAKLFEPIVSHKIVSVTSKIIFVLKKLYRTGECDMAGLYDGAQSKSEKVATFLAVLELTKSGRITINDDNTKVFFNKSSKVRKAEQKAAETVSGEATAPADEMPAETSSVEAEYEEAAPENDADVVVSESTDIPAEQVISEPVYERKTEEKAMSARIAPCMISIPVLVAETVPAVSEDTDEPEMTEPEKPAYEDISFEIMTGLVKQQVLRPNLWAKRRYYWGYSPVGSQFRRGYWKFG